MVKLSDHPYGSFLHLVEKPARYIGGEYNQVVKDPAGARAQLCLAFPDLYDIGMSHMGTKILYKIVNDEDDLLVERAFAPWPDMEAQLRERGLPVLSLETRRPLAEFDAVGFSLQYELTFTNMLNLLDLSGIPLRSADRGEADPIVLAGGPGATQPEPVAAFVDVFLVGDAEEKLPELLRTIAGGREAGLPRQAILVSLAKLGGLYVPSLYPTSIDPLSGFEVVGEPLVDGVPARPRREIVEDLNRFAYPDDSPVAAAEAIFDRMSVEIARGCTEGCRFCQAGMIYRPVRERDPQQVVDTVLGAIEKGGYDEAGLTTLSTADYSCISPLMSKLMAELKERKVSLSVASLRAYGLDENTLDEMASYRAQGLTFAPEAGSQRMRDVINKNVSEEDIARTAHRIFSRGWKRMKLYFMIGLPGETDEDVVEIMELGRRMKEIGREYHGKRAEITVSVSSHVPKPHTPFQWVAMDSPAEIERKQDLLHELSRRYRLEFRRHDPRTSFLEGVLGRGDRRCAKLVELAFRKGCRFDGWDEQLQWDKWLEALDESGIDPRVYLGTLRTDARTPWDHLDMQLEPRFLLTDYKRAMKDKLSPPCGKPAGAQVHPTNLSDADAIEDKRLVCYNCGVACDLQGMKDERREYLEMLGATTPNNGLVAREARMAKQDRVAHGSSPHDFGQGEGLKLRVEFRKTGADAMTGHLDLVRKLPRILRRAHIPVFYTEGYHPKPALSFGPALALGVEGARELVEIKLAERVEPADFLERVNAVAESGIEFLACRYAEPGERAMSKLFHRADYLVDLGRAGVGPEELAGVVGRLADAGEWPLEITRKRRVKTVDLATLVDEFRRAGEDDLALLPEPLRPAPGATVAFLRLRLDSGSQVKPAEALAGLLGREIELAPVDIARLGLWATGEDGLRSPLGGEPEASVDLAATGLA